ncbi:Ig-like domain-containing protein, partial [Pseudomonas sp. BN606]|uniref:beta strand repeat-containing protein n=1 Tax=Pseudomonas sp. BN606 TaxID=2567894 RepID=UPI0024587A43
DGPIAVTEDTPATGNVLTNDSDIDNDTLTVTQFEVGGSTYLAGQTATLTGVGTLVINANGSFTFTPALNYNGPVPTATYTVTDGTATDTAELSFGNVIPVNDASVLTPDTNSVAEDNPATGNVLGNDSDVDNVLTVASFSVAGVTGSFTAGQSAIIVNVGTFTLGSNGDYIFTPAQNWNGSVPQLTYVTNTGSSSTLDITVTPVDDASVMVPDTNTVAEDNPATGNVLGNDSDVDNTLTVASFSVAGVTGSFTAGQSATIANVGTFTLGSNGDYTFTPAQNWNGSVPQVTYVTNTGSSSTLDITVTPVNDAPETNAVTATGNEDTVIAVNLSGSDVDGTVASFKLTSLPANGTFYSDAAATIPLTIASVIAATGNGATIYFKPNAHWNGTNTFQYTATDNNSLEDATPANGTITVNPVNDAPETSITSATGNEDTVIAVNLSGSDVDGTVASFKLNSLPANGTFYSDAAATNPLTLASVIAATGNGATIYFKPNADWNGTNTFQYTATDNNSLTDATPATGTITVNTTNDAPVFGTTSGTATVSEEGLSSGLPDTTGSPTDSTNALVVNGTFAISDIDGPSLNVTLTAPTIALTSNGVPLVWSGSGTSMLSATAGGQTIMTISITSSGAYTVTLLGQLDHAVANAEDVRGFTVAVAASDGVSSSSGTLQIDVEDDAPVMAPPMQSILLDSSSATAIGELNLSIGADANGASIQFSTTTGVSVDSSGYILSTTMDKNGNEISTSSYLTYQGSKLHYVTGTNSVSAVATNGTEVFRITADPISGQYKVTNFVDLDSPSSILSNFNLSGGNSGLYDLGTNSRFSLQASATVNGVADTVNTSNNSFGVGSGQSIDTGDLLSFTFIDKSTNQTTDLTSVTLTTDKLGNNESLTWSAYNASGTLVGAGTLNGVSSGTTTFTIDASKLNSGQFEFSTIKFGAGSGTSYKLIIDSLTGQTDAYDQRITLGVKATDGDHDSTASHPLQITFDSDNTVQAGSAGTALGGGAGANNLIGGVGDDTLTGGKGSDTLWGGAGADTFVWKAGDAGSTGSPDLDVVKDFKMSEGDKLNLSDLLQGETSATIDNFLKLIVDAGTGNATLLVSKDGHLNDAGGTVASHADLSITLEGAAAQLSGSSINSLIAGADPTIKVDQN